MKKLLLSSPSFGGHVTVAYGEKKELLSISFASAQIEDNQVYVMKERVPVRYEGVNQFLSAIRSKTLRVIEEDLCVSFEADFWTPYNKKVNKLRALTQWDKLSKVDQVNAVIGLIAYKKHLTVNQWKTKADPETYLKNKMWLNEWN